MNGLHLTMRVGYYHKVEVRLEHMHTYSECKRQVKTAGPERKGRKLRVVQALCTC